MKDKMCFVQQNAPCYLYEEALIKERCHALLAAMPEVDFLYSVKTNPFMPVLKTVAAQGLGADAASANEVLLAEQSGIPSDRIYYSAPGKTAKSILVSCGARLAPFDIQELRELTAYDELQLDTLGGRKKGDTQKTALFLIMSDTDATFNFLISMIYSQLFNLLCEKADDEFGGKLKPLSYTIQPVEVYPAEQNHLPYDVVIQTLHAEQPEQMPQADAQTAPPAGKHPSRTKLPYHG